MIICAGPSQLEAVGRGISARQGGIREKRGRTILLDVGGIADTRRVDGVGTHKNAVGEIGQRHAVRIQVRPGNHHLGVVCGGIKHAIGPDHTPLGDGGSVLGRDHVAHEGDAVAREVGSRSDFDRGRAKRGAGDRHVIQDELGAVAATVLPVVPDVKLKFHVGAIVDRAGQSHRQRVALRHPVVVDSQRKGIRPPFRQVRPVGPAVGAEPNSEIRAVAKLI